MTGILQCIGRAVALLGLTALAACSASDGPADSDTAEAARAPAEPSRRISVEQWQQEHCGTVTFDFDEQPTIVALGRNQVGEPCDPIDGAVGLANLRDGALDPVRALVVYGSIDFDDIPPLFSRMPNLRSVQFLESEVTGDPGFESSRIATVLFEGSSGDFRTFGPLPELLDFSIGPGDGPVYLPEDMAAAWPNVRSISVGRAAVENLAAVNTAKQPIELVILGGHPQLGALGTQLRRIVISVDAAAEFAAELERLESAGVAVDRL
ncbi:MAG: hypothetical protein ACLFNT_09925 [Spirochaetales bacterium]